MQTKRSTGEGCEHCYKDSKFHQRTQDLARKFLGHQSAIYEIAEQRNNLSRKHYT